MKLTDFCNEVNNYFDIHRYFDTFTISGGQLLSPAALADGTLQDGQYFRIVGSVFNDGVYQYPASGLTDETFDGAVWTMAVPPAVTELLSDINAWLEKNGTVLDSPFQSESFGGYSYTKASGSSGSGSSTDASTWQGHFKNRLNVWRKIRP